MIPHKGVPLVVQQRRYPPYLRPKDFCLFPHLSVLINQMNSPSRISKKILKYPPLHTFTLIILAIVLGKPRQLNQLQRIRVGIREREGGRCNLYQKVEKPMSLLNRSSKLGHRNFESGAMAIHALSWLRY